MSIIKWIIAYYYPKEFALFSSQGYNSFCGNSLCLKISPLNLQN
jgi:hypothetical protein